MSSIVTCSFCGLPSLSYSAGFRGVLHVSCYCVMALGVSAVCVWLYPLVGPLCYGPWCVRCMCVAIPSGWPTVLWPLVCPLYVCGYTLWLAHCVMALGVYVCMCVAIPSGWPTVLWPLVCQVCVCVCVCVCVAIPSRWPTAEGVCLQNSRPGFDIHFCRLAFFPCRVNDFKNQYSSGYLARRLAL